MRPWPSFEEVGISWVPALMELESPAWLGLLGVPLLLLLLSFRRERPESVFTGTFALWRRAGEGSGVRRRRRLPLSRLALILGWIAGALALAGPRGAPEQEVLVWRVVVDGGSGLLLEHTDPDGRPTGSGRRLDVALELLESRAQLSGAELEFFVDGVRGLRPVGRDPSGWTELGLGERVDPVKHDRAGVVLLTDRSSDHAVRSGGVVTSGGGPVHGPVAFSGGQLVEWTGTSLLPREPSRPARIQLEGEGPPVLLELVALWAQARGLEVTAEPDAGVVLRVRFQAGQGEPARLARDGWSAVAEITPPRPAEGEGLLESWLSAQVGGRSLPVVAWSPGLAVIGIRSMGELTGEPGAFPVSWADFLDGAAFGGAEVVGMGLRADAGESGFRPPSAGSLARPPQPRSWASELAFLTALLVGLAVLLGEGGSG